MDFKITIVFLSVLCTGCLFTTDAIPENVTKKIDDTLLVEDDLSVGYESSIAYEPYTEPIEYCEKKCDCGRKLCVRKCCAVDYVFDAEGNCFHNPDVRIFRMPIYNHTELMNTTKPFLYLPSSTSTDRYMFEEEEKFYLQENGQLLMVSDSIRTLMTDTFCFDTIVIDKNEVYTLALTWDESLIMPDEYDLHFILYSVGMLISVPFLIATFLVYAIVPELRNLHGKSLMCHVISLAIGYTFLAIVQIHNDLPSSLCVSFGFTILFSFLVCFFWLNVMCFDIWWTFSGFRGFRGSKRAAEHKKFILYSAYAWGSPILIIIIALILQFHPSVSDNWVRPRIGDVKCFLHDDALLEYFYGLMLALIICNLGFFIATALKIFRIHKDTAVLKRDDSQRHDSYENDRQRLNLYFKLFVVMGINWSLELISYFTGGPKWLWYVTDIGNTLQGALIFVIFVCKRNVWKLLVKRYHTLTGKPHLGHVSMTRTTGFSTQQSTASQSNGNKFTSIDSSY